MTTIPENVRHYKQASSSHEPAEESAPPFQGPHKSVSHPPQVARTQPHPSNAKSSCVGYGVYFSGVFSVAFAGASAGLKV
jgi:hypothetical protein